MVELSTIDKYNEILYIYYIQYIAYNEVSMKRKFIVSLLLVVLIFVLSTTVLVACNKGNGGDNSVPDGNGGELLEYSVRVLNNNQPVVGVTVNWSVGTTVKGSAVTGDDGQATAKIAAGTYDVDLAGYADGLTYTRGTATATTRKLTMRLSVAQVTYSVKIIDKDGNPASGIDVNFVKDNQGIKGSATTGADGKAACTLEYGTYKITLGELPAGNVWTSTASVSSTTTDVEIRLESGQSVRYSVTVISEGGLLFKNEQVFIFDENYYDLVTSGYTNDEGVFSFVQAERSYVADLYLPQDGYTYDPVDLSASVHSAKIVLKSKPINTSLASNNTSYAIGDIIHDFTFTTTYNMKGTNQPFSKSISQMLAEGKKAIIINNWGTGCSYCVDEMPEMQEAYEKYGKDVEIIGLSNYSMSGDSNAAIESFVEQWGYTFPLMRDANNFAAKIGLGTIYSGWPLTVVIDRYGAIARIETGAILDAGNWGFMFEKYISDDYVQDFIPGSHQSDSILSEMAKPDIDVDPDHYEKIAEAINANFNDGMSVTYSAVKNSDGKLDEYAWPFLLGKIDGVSENDETLLYTSNYRRAGSYAAICLTVTAPAGKVFTFDYYCDTEATYDVISFIWDGKIVKQISGNSDGWQTCYLYTELTDNTHTLSIAYVKNNSGNVGKDRVYLKNVRFTEVVDIDSADMLRGAAYGTPAENATQFPYYAELELGTDGYYHVKLDTIQNNGYAGTDNSPLLLMNMLGVTNWDNYNSLYTYVYGINETTGEQIDCRFTVNGVTKDWRETLGKYLQIASSSDLYGYLPVDDDLRELIVAFVKRVKETIGKPYYENEWLELCYYYSHYGTGTPIGNPIIGITEKTALPVELNTVVTANLNRYTIPIPFEIHSFTAPEDGLYKIQSLIPTADAVKYQAQIWLYDDNTIDNPILHNGADRFIRDGVNEQNFTVYRYMHAGEKYYFQLAFIMQDMGDLDFIVTRVDGDSATVLEPASANTYSYVVGSNGSQVGNDYYLVGAIDYVKGADGYYHVKDSNAGDDYIYLDVKYMTSLTNFSVTALLDQELQDPYNSKTKLGYKVFDFRYAVNYIYADDGEGNLTFTGNYQPHADLTDEGDQYIDYTQYLKDYIANPDNAGPEDGLIKVDQSIVDIFTIFIEIRPEGVRNGKIEPALTNEWLRFCWYYKTYDANNN